MDRMNYFFIFILHFHLSVSQPGYYLRLFDIPDLCPFMSFSYPWSQQIRELNIVKYKDFSLSIKDFTRRKLQNNKSDRADYIKKFPNLKNNQKVHIGPSSVRYQTVVIGWKGWKVTVTAAGASLNNTDAMIVNKTEIIAWGSIITRTKRTYSIDEPLKTSEEQILFQDLDLDIKIRILITDEQFSVQEAKKEMPKPWIEIIHFPFHIETGEILKESVLSPTLDKSENKTEILANSEIEPESTEKESVLSPTLDKSENKTEILAKSEIEPESTEKKESTLMKEIDTETLKDDSECVNDGQEYNLETLKEDSEYVNDGQEYNIETLKEDSESVNDGQENNLETLKEDSEYRNYTEEYNLIESDLNRINLELRFSGLLVDTQLLQGLRMLGENCKTFKCIKRLVCGVEGHCCRYILGHSVLFFDQYPKEYTENFVTFSRRYPCPGNIPYSSGCPKGWIRYDYYCYWIGHWELDWKETSRVCRDEYSEVPILLDSTEHDLLEHIGVNTSVWIGRDQTRSNCNVLSTDGKIQEVKCTSKHHFLCKKLFSDWLLV
ncbi:uncharacterized protein LOC111707367 isoform X2 [Eurytemora carolleeae]|uniref:uncharacterized protein LOC111707367 isoform X2 n=1 Tax=Eurytemora carolleeae TaxID=1294199 RepID=UPI000C7641DA|nr:uncharacterized protein LOC111707367 isoform X2 [Eurytemora carolleeae]|eukprot:XP_023336235.1 uncharacterized protein LOC111707367 isoform X2 [Eurytemora affinis]